MNQEKKINLIFFTANILIAVIGCIRIFYSTNWGVWAFSDSASYFSAARNLIQGQGMIIEKTGGGIDYYQLFPPLYPATLGVVGWLLTNYFTAARWINIMTFGFFLFLSGWVLFNLTKKPAISLIAPALLLVSPMMIADFTGAMTEPIFLMLMMLSFLLVFSLLKEPKFIPSLLFVTVNALLPITRYVGIVIAASNFMILLFFMQKSLKIRILFSSIVTFIGSIPILAWFYYLYNITDRIGGRKFQLAESFVNNFFNGLKVIYDIFKTFLPYNGLYENIISPNIRFNLSLGIFALLITATIYFLTKQVNGKKTDKFNLEKYLIFPIYAIAFIVFICFSYSVTNRSYVIDHRQLSPLIPVIIIISLYSFSILVSYLKIPHIHSNIIILCLYAFIFRFYFFSSRTLVRDLHANGFGYTARQYQESGILDAIKKIPPDRIIISNSAAFVLLHDNRLPVQIDQFYAHRFGSGDAYGESKFRDHQAALLLILPDFNNYYGEQAAELFSVLTDKLQIAYQDPVSAIFYYPE